MDADTTLKANFEPSTEEVTTTSIDNNLISVPCLETGRENGDTADESAKGSSNGEVKQLEIVIMEEGHNDEQETIVELKTDEQKHTDNKDSNDELPEEAKQLKVSMVVDVGSINIIEENEMNVIVTHEEATEQLKDDFVDNKSEDDNSNLATQSESKLDLEAPDSSVDVDTSEQEDSNVPPKRRGRNSRKLVPIQDVPSGGKVEKVLQMKYKRSIKHYLVHWEGKDSSQDSWLILDPMINGFAKQVSVFDERRKKVNDRGEGSSSKKTSRTKHSWYYLSSSEDEDSMLKDNFWKNLDEGKLNLYQSPCDMYSSVKEIGRNSKLYNQEVCAAIPDDYLAETKRVTRSRVLTPVTKRTKLLSKVKKNVETDSTETNSTDKKETNKGKKRVSKTPIKSIQSKIMKREGSKKVGRIKKKLKSSSSEIISRTSNDEDEDEDDQESEDDVSEMLVPITPCHQPIEEVKTKLEKDSLTKDNKELTTKDASPVPKKTTSVVVKTVTHSPKPTKPDSACDDGSSGVSNEVAKTEELSKEVKLRHLSESIDVVIEESRRWYEEHFNDDNDSNQDDDGKKKKSKKKKGWTSFLDVNSKKRKEKLDKFQDESKDDDASLVKQNDRKFDEKESKDVEEPEKLQSIEEVEIMETSVASPCKDEDKVDKSKDEDEKKPIESVQPLKLMDEQTKMELAKKVSQYIMKGTFDKRDKKSSDESTKHALDTVAKSACKDESSEMQETNESEIDQKSCMDELKQTSKDHKKISGPLFNLKLMRVEDIASKREKMARTHIDSSRPTNVQFLMAIKSNDIVKVRTMLENVGQINLEFIDMKTGLSLVWLAVKNNLISILILLATHGADVEKRNRDGLTPLLYAADKGFFQTVHTLCSLGVNLYATAPDGDTAIIKAIKNRHKNVVQILLGTGISLGENSMVEKNLTHLAKHVGASEVIEIINSHKTRLNQELLLRASQCFESSVKIEQQVFPIQCFRMIDSRHFMIHFRHELQPTKKSQGMLLFIGHGQVSHNDMVCSLKGKSQVTRVVLNEHQLQSIADDQNFVFSFSPLVEGSNRLEIFTHPLSRDNHQMRLVACAYTIELDLGITSQ